MLGTYVIHHDGGRASHIESVRHAAGKINRVMEVGTQFDHDVVSEGRGAPTHIEEYIYYFSGDAIDEFGVVSGWQLELHPTQNVCAGDGIEGLDEASLKPAFDQTTGTHCFYENTASVGVDRKLNKVAARDVAFGKRHGLIPVS